MCSFNIRNYKQCEEDPKHTFKEVLKCAERQNSETCVRECWENLRNAAKTSTSIVCPICNDIEYILQMEEENE